MSLKEQWLTALRSGEYRQTDSYLHKGNGFCCLGVLADICGAGWEQYDFDISEGIFHIKGTEETAIYRGPNGELSDEAETLAEMNDNGSGFGEIADYIERHFSDSLEYIWEDDFSVA